ncbi:MAG TPA: TraB/GumN family protein, partial [Thermoclostridium caenicola]|nr:TraB/GumN family protein [Thermoclostridium caenicola]
MKRRLLLLVLILTVLSLCFGACTVKVHQSLPETGSVFMWEVKAKEGDGKLYLLGSIHVGYDGLYPLNPVITNAFEQSDVLAVECDTIAALERPDYLKLAEKLL